MNMTIIFGSHGYNTLGVIHCMAEKKMNFLLLLVKGSRLFNVTLHSKYVKHFHVVSSEDEGVQWLMTHKEELKNSVIYPTSDRAESVLDFHYDALLPYFHFPNAGKQGEVNRLMNKEVQIKMAKEAGLNALEMFNNVKRGVKYPCLIKARKSIRGGKKEMKVCRSESELQAALDSSLFSNELLIQEYIDKEYDLLLIGCRMPDGKVLIPGIFKKERWYLQDGSFGVISTCVDNYFHQKEEVRHFVESLGYTGPFSIEFGVKNGKAYFYEINLRNDGTSHYFHPAGIFIPYWYAKACAGLPISTELPSALSIEYCFIDEFGDSVNLFSSRLSCRQWLKDVRSACVYKYYVPYDKAPFYHLVPRQILSVGYNILKLIGRRCRKGKTDCSV